MVVFPEFTNSFWTSNLQLKFKKLNLKPKKWIQDFMAAAVAVAGTKVASDAAAAIILRQQVEKRQSSCEKKTNQKK